MKIEYCPRCGSVWIMTTFCDYDSNIRKWHTFCQDCKLDTHWAFTKRGSIHRWNRQARKLAKIARWLNNED